MAIWRNAIVMVAALCGIATTQSAWADSVSVKSLGGKTQVSIAFYSDSVFGGKVLDALARSTAVREVANEYVMPGTYFLGKNVAVDLNARTVILSLDPVQSGLDLVGRRRGGAFARISDRDGVARELLEILLASRSQAVLKRENLNPSGRQGEMAAFVLENGGYAGSRLTCRMSAFDGHATICEFDLN